MTMLNSLEKDLKKPTYYQFVKQEQAIKIVNYQPITLLIQVVFICACVFIFKDIVNKNVLWIWASSHFLLFTLRATLTHWFFSIKKANTVGKTYANLTLSFCFINSVLWGLTAFYIDLNQYPEESFFLMIISIGIGIGAMGIGSYWLKYYFIYTPTMSIIFVFAFIKGVPEPNYIFATIFIAFTSYISRLVYVSYHNNIINLILRKKNEVLANTRTRFLAAASHDLRQPLQALNLFLSVLKNEFTSNPKLMGQIDKSTQAMNDMLTRLLDVSKLDSVSLQVQKQPIEIESILLRLENNYLIKAQQKELKLSVQLSSLWVKTDPLLLERVLSNLIENAINYTEAGYVKIDTQKLNSNQLMISIVDTGIGINETQQNKIFDEFYQVNNQERDSNKGIGLGLSIVQRICDLLDITLSFKSEVGKGSAFSLLLPLTGAQTVKPLESDLLTSTKWDVESKLALIIDDNLLVRQALESQLTIWGMKVLACESAQSAITMLNRNLKPDIVISDYCLADDKTGIDAINLIKIHVKSPLLPSLIISGDTSPNQIDIILSKGFKLLHKPVKPAVLRRAIQRELNSKI